MIERQPYKLPISPGLNLVSLPADPADESLNAVFGGEPDIVHRDVTYENATGLWLTAAREEDGTFTGDLITIDANHGYFMVISDTRARPGSHAAVGATKLSI